jgi:hypothetical protein
VTASLLGNEGTRVIVLLTDGESPNKIAAQMEAEAAKQAGISIYAAGIGGSISEDELNGLASFPPAEYRVYIKDFAEEALNEELQSLIASICLIPEIFTIGQELEEMLIKGRVRSLQYYLPEKGLTVTANVSGGANMYMSRTIRNPTILSANITTGGSGILSVYVSFNSSMKKPADVDTVDTSSTIFVSIIANRENTTFRASTAVGNMTIRFPPDAPVKFRVQKYTSQISYFEWYPPLRTNGIINKYTLLCIPELFGLPNCTVKIDSSIYLTALGRDITAESSCLERGLTYNCSLNATNDEGHGPPIFTQLVEDSQLKLMCSEVTLGKANCTWERLVGFILTYRVICNLTTTNTMKYNESTTELSVMVNTPTPATLHTCYVMTTTIFGDVNDYHCFVTAPWKPRKVKAWREGPDKVELTWITRRTAIEDDIIKNYNVFIYGLDKKWITNSYDKNYTLISPILRDNNLKVLIRVQAVNDAGEGPKSGAMCWYNTPRPRAN